MRLIEERRGGAIISYVYELGSRCQRRCQRPDLVLQHHRPTHRSHRLSCPRVRKPSANFRDADFFDNLGIAHPSSGSYRWFLPFAAA